MPTTTSNMGLKIPNTGETDYATSVSDSFTAIDVHDHSSGKGKQIVTDGIEALAVTEAKLANGAVTEAKLGTAAVTEAKIGSGAVTEAKLGTAAVTEAKIGSGAVTEAKIGALAVTTAKIAALAVTNAKIQNGAVTDEKRSAGNTQISPDASGDIIGTVETTILTAPAINTYGRPVLCLIEVSGAGGSMGVYNGSTVQTTLKIKRDATTIMSQTFRNNSAGDLVDVAPQPVVDNPVSAGYVYTVTITNFGTARFNYTNIRLRVVII